MYLTRPRSLYRKFRSSIPEQQQLSSETPNLGYVIVTDEESEELDSFCWGICKSNSITSLPFPQDRILKVVHTLQFEEASTTTKAWFLPVLDQPLSSNRYYIIKATGKHKGRAYTCAQVGGGERACCFSKVTKLNLDRKPKRFDYRDIYQQFEIHRYHNGGFFALSVAWDGVPPKFLRTKGWEVYTTSSFKVKLVQAQGLINSQQMVLPKLDFPLHSKRSDPVVIGRWYCPFVFVKEDIKTRDQIQRSLFYEVTLKQWWEEIYSCENEANRGSGNVVAVNANVKRRVVLIGGMEAVKESRRGSDGDVWFKVKEGYEKRVSVGLSSAMFEKLRCLQERRGWFDRKEIEVKVDGEKEIRSEKEWKRFGCYVLVESFVFRRMDGTLLMNFSFKNTDRIECRCE